MSSAKKSNCILQVSYGQEVLFPFLRNQKKEVCGVEIKVIANANRQHTMTNISVIV